MARMLAFPLPTVAGLLDQRPKNQRLKNGDCRRSQRRQSPNHHMPRGTPQNGNNPYTIRTSIARGTSIWAEHFWIHEQVDICRPTGNKQSGRRFFLSNLIICSTSGHCCRLVLKSDKRVKRLCVPYRAKGNLAIPSKTIKAFACGLIIGVSGQIL